MYYVVAIYMKPYSAIINILNEGKEVNNEKRSSKARIFRSH